MTVVGAPPTNARITRAEGTVNGLIKRSVAATAFVGGSIIGVLVPASPASSAPPEFPHGVGVCMSQIAIAPELAEAERFGDIAQAIAGPGLPGSDLPGALGDLRGDGPGGCGAPPGPRHLQ